MATGDNRYLGTAENTNELLIHKHIGKKILLKCLFHILVKLFLSQISLFSGCWGRFLKGSLLMLLSQPSYSLGNSASVNRANCRLFPSLFRCEGVLVYPVCEIQAVSHWKWFYIFPSWTGCSGLHHHLLSTLNITLWDLWLGDKCLITPHSRIHPGCPFPVFLPGHQRRVGKAQGLQVLLLNSQSQMMMRKPPAAREHNSKEQADLTVFRAWTSNIKCKSRLKMQRLAFISFLGLIFTVQLNLVFFIWQCIAHSNQTFNKTFP